MTAVEVVKLTAIPNGVDTTRGVFNVSVVISPELSGGDGTIALTDFENWPATLASWTQNGEANYYPAYWDVLVSDDAGNTLIDGSVELDTSATNADLWASLFPPTTTFTGPDSDTAHSRAPGTAASRSLIDDRFRAIPILSYPARQIVDFVTGQYQQYSPTQVPDFATIASVYADVSDGLIGVVGQQAVAAQARERAARSLGGTVPHANDLTTASTAEAYAAFSAYQEAKSSQPPAASYGTIDFHAALTYIAQHRTLQRALGLVFDLPVYYYDDTAKALFSGSTPNSNVYVSVSLVSQRYGDARPTGIAKGVIPAGSGQFAFTQVCSRTQCDADATTFAAHSLDNIKDGQLDGSDSAGKVVATPISIVGDVNSTSQLPYKLATLQRAQSAKKDYSSGDFDVSYEGLYVPPPTLRSAGVTVAQIGAGQNLASLLGRANTAADAADAAIANPAVGSNLLDFVAEDLVRGYILDVYDMASGVWRSTAERNITYTSGSIKVSAPTSAPFDEAAVQAPPQLVSFEEDKVQFTQSEILLTYNGWSAAVPRPGKVLSDNDSNVGTVPQGGLPIDISIEQSVPAGRLAPLRFGHTYRLRVRVVDLANNRVDVSDPAADQLYTEQILYGRLEPIPTPDIYPQGLPRLGESLKRLVVRDIDASTPSLRALYPQRISGQFAEAHGLFDTSAGDPDPNAYTTIVPRESGSYPDPPQPPADATTQPPTIALDQPVPFLPDPLARGAVFRFTDDSGQAQAFNIDFSPQQGAAWPDYRPYGLELTPGSTLGASIDTSRRVITFTVTPADDVTVSMTTTCDAADASLLGIPSMFKALPDASDIAAGFCWAVTPSIDLELVYAVQKPLATPELSGLTSPRVAGSTSTPLIGKLAWSPKSTSEVDVVAAWSEPVDDPSQNRIQGPGTDDTTLRDISNSPVATLRGGDLEQAKYYQPTEPSDEDQLTASDPVSFTHEFLDTKHREVTYSALASSRFAEYYPDGTDVTVTSATSIQVNILSSAQPEPPAITDVVPIFDWSFHDVDTTGTLVSDRSPSALRVFLARPWWTSGIGELLGVVTYAESDTNLSFMIAPTVTASDWASDPVFASAPLPSAHPRLSAFPKAVKTGTVLDQTGSGTGFEVAGHAVAFDSLRNSWYCDITVDTGAAYTPMMRLALARWQPDSVAGVELSEIVMTQIVTLEPGRTLTIVPGKGSLKSVQLTGYSYSRAAGVAGPGFAQLQVERRDESIDDATLGWELVEDPIPMSTPYGTHEPVTWIARNVKLPGAGPHRIVVTQYENLPGASGSTTPAAAHVTYPQLSPGHGYRLVHQDIVEV